MARDKILIDQAGVLAMAADGKIAYTIANVMKLPRSAVDDILAGKDRPYYFVKNKKDRKGVCECCHCNPIAPGFMKLCYKCFHSGGDSDERRSTV